MEFIGKGAYGTLVINKGHAQKKFQKVVHVIQEYAALKYLDDCLHIVHGKGVNYEKKELQMELYEMSLRVWMNNHKCCMECVYQIIHDILCGLVEIQDRGLSHSDIKPGNILIKLNPLKAVLADLGFVSLAKYSKQQRTAPNYHEQNIVNDQKHDMYSFGLCFMELIYGIKPVVSHTYDDYSRLIDKKVDKNHQDLIKRLMSQHRHKRPLAREVLSILFNETPLMFIRFKHDYSQYDDCYHLHDLIKMHCKKLNINRGIYGYQALLMYLNKHKEHEKIIPYYICALIIILASVFSQKTPSLTDITMQCQVQDHRKIYHALHKLTNDNLFLKCLYS